MALIVIRIVPTESVEPATFTAALNNLSIEALELSFANPDGLSIGTASYLPPTNLPASPDPFNPPIPTQDPATRIVQHFEIDGGGPFERNDFSVATAVINIPVTPEYDTVDLLLKITRGPNIEIIHEQRYYNIPVDPAAMPGPSGFQGLNTVSLYLSLPLSGVQVNTATDAFVNMPVDGSAPNYEDLLGAVQLVLSSDPSGPVVIANMDLKKCRHVAHEIAWNRILYPLPSVPANRKLEEMYTGIHDVESPEERDRRKFEGDLQGYFAVHNAEAEKLTQYIFGIAAAQACERESTNATTVFFRFPVTPGFPTTAGKTSETQLILKGVGTAALAPPFTVTANYFYAIASDLPIQVDASQRFQIAIHENEQSLKTKMTKAIASGVIKAPVGPAQTKWQAVRRLRCLYVFDATTVITYTLNASSPEHTLIQNFLKFPTEDINGFWNVLPAAGKAAHLKLLLAAFTKETGGSMLLTVAIKAIPVANATALKAVTEAQWRALFDPDPPGDMNRLPAFISAGSPEERIKAFLRYARKFFDATGVNDPSPGAVAGFASGFGRPADNPLDLFIASQPGFTFSGWNGLRPPIQAALDIVFPSDADAQDQFFGWLNCIKGLLDLAVVIPPPGITPPEMQFAVMEALWARGMTSTGIINHFSEEQLKDALIGSVAYNFVHQIWVNAGSVTPNSPASPSGFVPVNPDGSLTNCIPPLHRSPLGPVSYLHDLLQVSEDSTCDDPFKNKTSSTLAELLKLRRGALGELLGSESNQDVPILLIDIVNESLEFMVDTATKNGIVYNTASDEIGEHFLKSNTNPPTNARMHDPETLLEVLPEHSTPATPTKSQHAYELLRSDFSSYDLPYSQALDINCTYLKALGTSRYATMRRYRKEITEFVLDPNNETAEFQNHLWRYPVKLESATGYFCMSPEELTFFSTPPVVETPPALDKRKTSKKKSGTKASKDKRYLLYGYFGDTIDRKEGTISWLQDVSNVAEFLERTGLSYCEFIELWKSEFVKFHNGNDQQTDEFPECEPCCLDDLTIVFDDPSDPALALYELNVFIRLWRKMKTVKNASYTFTQLRDICKVLGLFDSTGVINADFMRQLLAFQMFRDDFQLALTDGTTPSTGTEDAERTHLLAFWQTGASKLKWAVHYLLDQIQQYAQRRFGCGCLEAEEIKLLYDNLDDLAELCGFEPDGISGNHHWHEQPTKTLRFAEILSKIYASNFTVGDLLFLFTASPHLDGDDPFPLQMDNEANDSPFGLPDDEDPDSLWTLRKNLLKVHVGEETIREWTWWRMENSLREDFGLTDPAELLSFGQHFFPGILAANGIPVSTTEQRYYAIPAIPGTAPDMWNTPQNGPFRYDPAKQQLFSVIPLTDEAVMAKLARIRQLTNEEQQAVQDLYFMPRVALARFAFLFSNFGEAEEKLIQEPEEQTRWAWFQKEFAVCYARTKVIQDHLASHVTRVTEQENPEGPEIAKLLLKSIWGDENFSVAPDEWENDNGQAPKIAWGQTSVNGAPNGGAYAALLGLVGTGMQAEYYIEGKVKVWKDVRGGSELFGQEENDWNTPVPTVLPAMNLVIPTDLSKFASFHNGFALANLNDERIGGAEPFTVHWNGLLLVDQAGSYSFSAGAPTEEGIYPDFEKIKSTHKWRVGLKRGQKTWVLLSHEWPDEEAPGNCSKGVSLKKGTYNLSIDVERNPISFDDQEDVCKVTTGFQLKYAMPDNKEHPVSIPFNMLFQNFKDDMLATGITTLKGVVDDYLKIRYTSSVRDIRRTYIRSYKALLFAHQLELSAQKNSDNNQSELQYMLENPANFAGQSYYRTSPASTSYTTHKANFDLNFLPVDDNYYQKKFTKDMRVAPTVQRQQAMFDWWERLFDYTVMRKESSAAGEHPVWLLFHESKELHPDDDFNLLRHMGVSANHSKIVQRYNFNTTEYELNDAGHPDDLNDDRWAVRAWKAEQWLRLLECNFSEADIRTVRPDLWASLDPNSVEPFEASSGEFGNANLTKFYRDGCIENVSQLRYKNIKQINDGLRLRGRNALVSYLTHGDRVALPSGDFAKNAKDLSELLLIDVETGICEKASRIEEAVTVAQLYIQRSRLGLEPDLTVTQEFIEAWDRHFATFRIWEACKRHAIYRENWVEWDELGEARQTETYQFLENKLREATLTVAIPGGLAYWNGIKPPASPGLTLLQKRQPATMQILDPDREGLGLTGTPDRHARPALLAPLKNASTTLVPENPNGGDHNNEGGVGILAMAESPQTDMAGLPLWLQAAVRPGTKFIRVAAAGIPPGSVTATAKCGEDQHSVCCSECGKIHPVLLDEYYFWIEETKYFTEQKQEADWGAVGTDLLTDWHRSDKLPSLLNWNAEPKVLLRWCRVHNGEFQQPNQSYEGVRINSDPLVVKDLVFIGRIGDSLHFKVTGGVKPLPDPPPPLNDGYPDLPLPGFRYDMQPDEAIVLPQVIATLAPTPIAGLSAYPFFAYFNPGKSLLPPSFFNPSLAVAGQLRMHCQFEPALKWYEFFYNPLLNDNTWKKCSHESDKGYGGNEDNGNDGEIGITNEFSLTHDEGGDDNGDHDNVDDNGYGDDSRKESECCCASDPVDDLTAKNRSTLLQYLETLVQWGDALMRKNTPEAFQQARLIFDTAEKILGDTPITVQGQADPDLDEMVEEFIPDCAPLNPRLLCLYTTLSDRLSLIHACLNARRLHNGKPNLDMPYFGNSKIRDCWKTSDDVCIDEFDWCLPQSPYRFLFLLQKAQDMSAEVRALGGTLLAAYEKGDGEYLSSIRAMHERQLLNLALDIRKQQWRESDWQVQALQKTKENAITRRQYYADLISHGLKSGEIQYDALSGVSQDFRLAANISETAAGIMGIIPDIYAGFPVTQIQLPIGSKLAEATLMTVGRIMNALAERASSSANLELGHAGWSRRQDEWIFQMETIDIEIQQIERQILAAERRRTVALSELNNQQQQAENAAEVHEFLRDKFTNHALYLFLQQETAALYYQMYDLALYCARQAQRAFNLERGHTSRKFIPTEIWDNLHEGLLSGERLSLAIRQMEKSFYDENVREYELTKHISLRLHSPVQFLQLRETGYCEIQLPEWLFDLDYPGHYMRRIKNVTLSIPCIAGPYTGIHSRLTLLSSTTRVSPKLIDPINSCCKNEGCMNGYETMPDDPRIVNVYTATEAIATSGGQNDSGMFELNFRDERYLPFEYEGAVSRWRIEIPHENNFFDINTLTDVVIHLNFMAREGGDLLRKAANECAQQHVPGDGIRLIDVKQETPDAWYSFHNSQKKIKELPLKLNAQMFPYLPGNCKLWFKGFDVFFDAECSSSPDGMTVQFAVNPAFADLVPDECDGDIIEIHCVHSAEWPGLFHGSLPLEKWPITSGDLKEFGRLRFPSVNFKINNFYLLAGYSSNVESVKNRFLN